MGKAKKKPRRKLLEEVECPVCGKKGLRGITTKPRPYSRQLCSKHYTEYLKSRRAIRAETLKPVLAPCGKHIKPGPLGTRGDNLSCMLECSESNPSHYWQCLSYAAARYWDGWEVV